MTRVLITGAGGFIGHTLARQLLSEGIDGAPVTHLTLVDLDLTTWEFAGDLRLHFIKGSIAAPRVMDAIEAAEPDVVFHLASVPGGAAERDYELGRTVNLTATLDLMERLSRSSRSPRFVFASSIAVYGDNLPTVVDETTTLVAPKLSYGAHKLAGEVVLSDLTRRGRIEGCALRLPGVVARPGPSSGLMSAYMSDVFWAAREGRAITVPVGPQSTAWWISARACARNLARAAALPLAALKVCSVYQMPALHLTMEEVVSALGERFGGSGGGRVTYAPNEMIEGLFGRYPALLTPHAHAQGFMHDGSIAGLLDAIYKPS